MSMKVVMNRQNLNHCCWYLCKFLQKTCCNL